MTAGWLRASLREVDDAASAPGAPALPCRTAKPVPVGEDVVYRSPLVPNARRFAVGHRIRLVLTSDDQDPAAPVIMNFRHATVGTSSLNTVRSTSRLLLPVIRAAAAHEALKVTPLFRTGFWLACCALACAFAWPRRESAVGAFALATAGSALLYVLSFAALGVAGDFRYGYWAVPAALAAATMLAAERMRRS